MQYYKHEYIKSNNQFEGWFCKNDFCGQYNGFTSDGNYNISHTELINNNCWIQTHKPKTRSAKLPQLPTSHVFRRKNSYHLPLSQLNLNKEGVPKDAYANDLIYDKNYNQVRLCSQCQHNEEIKLQMLQSYDPYGLKIDANRAKEFKNSLEKQFPLCFKCQKRVNLKLHDTRHKLSDL